MTTHILAMNVVAPLAVWLWPVVRRRTAALSYGVVAAAGLQLALMWGWHMPEAMRSAASHPALAAAMHASLFLSALLFWGAVFQEMDRAPWRSLAALLLTGKFFCLLGILLVFAPRPLYASAQAPLGSIAGVLADQQMAGLLMIIACPVTYVLGSILIVRRWMVVDEIAGGWRPVSVHGDHD
ncbi:cytochrome c oxidase assembly protein [Roseibium salinum]|uniref:Cytochrome c oxidase assembly protein n=1 Tax=Roseibium salinum TaxID=1604349 RepID=A0ABT3QXF4_9HYPH|nr:cytochrome c oxidase assembly protein [Roseibium sp. DSM 29163]MCX2721550.1 cytochrome c oxidase assembly protein [Roseibium sp. DSM 29163]MDN3722023.1 cytochrome c oxidase assembly protein [Roseibium salinum]